MPQRGCLYERASHHWKWEKGKCCKKGCALNQVRESVFRIWRRTDKKAQVCDACLPIEAWVGKKEASPILMKKGSSLLFSYWGFSLLPRVGCRSICICPGAAGGQTPQRCCAWRRSIPLLCCAGPERGRRRAEPRRCLRRQQPTSHCPSRPAVLCLSCCPSPPRPSPSRLPRLLRGSRPGPSPCRWRTCAPSRREPRTAPQRSRSPVPSGSWRGAHAELAPAGGERTRRHRWITSPVRLRSRVCSPAAGRAQGRRRAARCSTRWASPKSRPRRRSRGTVRRS